MKTQHRAMLCGASFIALSAAMPLQAQTVPGLDLPSVYVIGATEVIASGVTDEAAPASTAIVNTVPTGTVTQLVQAEEAADGALSLTNDGTVGIRASATAVNADGQAISLAQVEDAISQIFTTPNSNLSATFLNNNVLVFGSSALATGTSFEGDVAARATSSMIGGVHQEVTVEGGGGGSATVTQTNAKSITATSVATAQAEGDVVADAVLQEAVFMRAQANGAGGKDQLPSITTTIFTNSGSMALSATALGTSTDGNAEAVAAAGGGEHGLIHVRAAANGIGDDSATVTMTNAAGGAIGVTTSATANALLEAEASAVGDTAIVVKAQASGADLGLPSATLTNAGTINIAATSVAQSTDAAGGADAETTLDSAIFEIAEAGGPESFTGRSGSASLTNSGSITISGAATATSLGVSFASAVAEPAVLQEVEITGVGAASFVNSGSFSATTTATATGEYAGAEAVAVGVEQELLAIGGVTASFTNSGTFAVNATAAATGTVGAEGALAQAAGFAVDAEPLDLAVSNAKTFSVSASATANGATLAEAGGMIFQADFNPFNVPPEGEGGGEGGGEDEEGGNPDNGHNGGGGEGEDEEVTWEGVTNAISGTVSNGGTLTVSASSFGSNPDVEMSLLDSSDDRTANAVGIRMLSAVNTATVTNTGTLTVSAISNGSTVDAKGIVLRDFTDSPVVPGEDDRFTIINNGGTIVARQSTNGGTNWVRGTAIDTERAPNGGDIRLQGNGFIYGDIKISDADTITVSGGETRFDGVINPYVESMEPVPVEVAAFAAFAPAGPLVGSLSIAGGGTLYLVDQPNNNPSYSGPAGANVATFSIASGGTLALQLPTNSNPVIAQAAYPFINAGTANLGGTLLLRPSSPNGLYGDNYVYADVIDADTRNGSFASVVTDTGSPLLAVSAVYDGDANVDLNIARVGFGSVPGLTVNQAATGNGIENVYAPNLTGPFAGLLGTLFTLDADAYPDALEQLSGDQYAGYLQGLRNYSLQTNTMISDQLDCAVSIDGRQKCRARDGEVRVWALGNYNDVSVDTDINAPGYSGNNWSVLLGVDYTTGNFTFGAFGGYRETSMDFTRGAGRIDADGWQFGGVAAYDTGDFYVRAIGSYSGLSGDSTRTIAVGTFAGAITGEPDANVTSIYGEAGARFDVGKTWVTPFVALDYTSVGLQSFTEAGVPGANLGFDDQSQNQTSLLLGLKWAGNFGGIIPEAKVAWRYDLNNELFGVDPYFADAPAGSTYRVFAPTTDTSSVVVGVSLAAALGKQATGRIGYQGRYNGQVTDNAFYGSLTIAFGRAPAPMPAPPPPPPPAPAPLPPCPPAAVTPGPFLVFFDWDKSLITAEAAQILERAAEQYAATGQTRVEIAGHTDTSGTATYNMALGQRRADAVKAYLATKGVPDGAMVTQSFGETRLLVETADGVREPQNRRAEITFSGAATPATGPCTPQ